MIDTLMLPGRPALALHCQPAVAPARGDVLYVHGSTFWAMLSVFWRVDGRSWADALNEAGFNAWGLDFAGYGASERYAVGTQPVGNLEQVLPQLERAVAAIRARNGGEQVMLLAHSWGGTVASAYAAQCGADVAALALFAPVTVRERAGADADAIDFADAASGGGAISPAQAEGSHIGVTTWAQYRRFIEDVPAGAEQVFDEAHFERWVEAFLASGPAVRDAGAAAVPTPSGPRADIQALRAGRPLFDAARIAAPTLLVRGVWDTVCTAEDAQYFLAGTSASVRRCVDIERGTHLLHLEAQRELLYQACNDHLLSVRMARSRPSMVSGNMR